MNSRTPKYPWSFSQDQTPYCRNITVGTRRTSVRMEPMVWQSLAEIAENEGYTINDLCTRIDGMRGPMGLTAAIRLFVLHYYRLATATPCPHADASTVSPYPQSPPRDVPPGFCDPGTTMLVPGPASVERALEIFNWTQETLSRLDAPVSLDEIPA